MQLCLPSSPGKTRMFPIIFSLSSFVVALYVVSRVLRKHYLLASQGSFAVVGKLDVTQWNCVFVLRSKFSESVSTLSVRWAKQVKTRIFYFLTRQRSQEKKNYQSRYRRIYFEVPSFLAIDVEKFIIYRWF